MSSLAKALRIACHANNLGTSGSSAVLLKRLAQAGKAPRDKSKSKGANAKKKNTNSSNTSSSSTWLCNGGVCKKVAVKKPKTMAPIKMTGKGTRMSASYYFHELCKGKISLCKPQVIQEPSGRHRLKEIKIVNGATGKHPRWVLVDRA